MTTLYTHVGTASEERLARWLDSQTRVRWFAFGAMRPGHTLAGMVNVELSTHGTIYNYGLYGRKGGEYPALVDLPYGEVHGEILWCAKDDRLMRTIRRQITFGFIPTLVNVYVADDDENQIAVNALTFVTPMVPQGSELITSGDWTIPN